MPPQQPPPGGDGGTGGGGGGGGAPPSPSRGPWIIAGAIVVVGLVIVIVMVLLFRDSGTSEPVVSVTPTESPSPSPTPTRTRSPKPSVTPTESPTPAPSPSVDNSTLVREATQDAAEADRPGEVKHVGNVDFYKNTACATRQGAQANVRYTTPQKVAIFILCQKSNGNWKVTQGPIYGE